MMTAILSQQEDSLLSLSGWLSSRSGFSTSHHVNNLALSDCEMQGYCGSKFTVRGLVSQDGARKDDVILSIPLNSCIQDTECAEVYQSSPWNVNMACFILQHKRGNEWQPYIETLPSLPPDTPLLIQSEKIKDIQYPPAMEAVERYKKFASDAFDSWQGADATASTYSKSDFLWALHMVQSRSIRLAVKGIRVMIPGIDLLNHGGALNHGFLALSGSKKENQSICFVVKRDVEKGTQVLWSYGDRCNDDFFVYHGFSLPLNKDEDVSLFSSVDHLIDWATHHLLGALPLIPTESIIASSLAGHLSASIHASASIPGTCSSLLVSSSEMSLLFSAQAKAEGDLSFASEPLEGRASKAFRLDLDITRRLSSFRLHQSDWGTKDEKSLATELVGGTGGKVDVRIISVLAMLVDRVNGVSGEGEGKDHKMLGFSVVTHLISARCRELLDSYPTTLAQDEAMLESLDPSLPSRGTLDYRMGKKQVLADLIDVLSTCNS